MKTLRTTKLLVLIASTLFLSCNNDQEEHDQQKKLDAEISQVHKNLEILLGKDVPSVSVLIDGPKGTFFTSSVGKNGHAITENTYLRFASNTKNFTATAILNMMQDGWLNLDDKIVSNIPTSDLPYVPTTAEWDIPYKDEITIKQLLQHNGGVFDVSNDPVPGFGGETYVEYMLLRFPNYQFSSTDLVRQVTINNLTYGPPNTSYHYSNTGYTILGEIIARVYSLRSGQSKTFKDYLHDKIHGPNSKVPIGIYFADQATDVQLPSPYVKGMIVYKEGVIITDKINTSGHVAEGNGIGTMTHLNRYIRTLMKGENVLTKSSVTMMQNDRGIANPPDNPYALGCLRNPIFGYGHNGATEGYISSMFYDPKTDVSVIVVIPYWDVTEGKVSLDKCLNALVESSIVARKVFDYQ